MTDSPRPPRIVSLDCTGTEIVCGLGLRDHLLGVSHECHFPPSVRSLPRLTATRLDAHADSGEIDRSVQQMLAAGEPLYDLDAERLAALQPDLILTQAQCSICAVDREDVERCVVSTPGLHDAKVLSLQPASLDELYRDIERVGAACGAEQAARRWIEQLAARCQAVSTAVAGQPRPNAASIEWTEPLMIAGNWVPELIERAGGRCELASGGVLSAVVDWQTLVDADPNVLLVCPCGFELPRAIAAAESLRQRPEWQTLRAVAAGRAYALDGDALLNHAGPRLIDSLELLAALFHPRQVQPPPHLQNAWQRL